LLIALRVFWISRRIHGEPGAKAHFAPEKPMPPARQIFVVGWTGMRGVISLAAAIARRKPWQMESVHATRLDIFLPSASFW